jgi:hypothetical protein
LCSLTDVDRLEDCRRDLFIAEGLAKIDRQEEARRNSEVKDEWSAQDVGILLWARCTRAPLSEALRMGRRLVHTPALTEIQLGLVGLILAGMLSRSPGHGYYNRTG